MTVESRPALGRLVLPVLLSGVFVQLISVTVMQIAVPAVSNELAAGSGAGRLVLAGYTLSYACTLITAARLGDRYGYRRIFVLGLVVFLAGAVTGAAAPNVAVLIGARLVQGLGSGLMAPQILSIIQIAFPPGRRARVMSAYGGTMAIASLAGPLLGGVVLDADVYGLGWRAAMLLAVPVAVAALVLSPVLPGGAAADTETRIDPAGVALSLAGLALLVLPLTLGQDAGWPPWAGAMGLTGLALLAVFAWYQRRARNPLVHPAALATRATRRGVALVLLFNAGVPSFTLVLSLYAQQVLGRDALAAALLMVPFAGGALVGSLGAGRVRRRLGKAALTISALVFGLIAIPVAVTLGEPGREWALWASLVLGGMAFGVFTAQVFTEVLSGVPEAAVSSVSGLLPTAQQIGGTLGVAMIGVVSGNDLTKAMAYQLVILLLAALLADRRDAGRRTAREATLLP
ncbi:MFS transporter [Actinoplanes sp. NBRC 103695]|uniref:MFS transporter n=1 Tax=Actinoplanes sp. NBRC 103695 TaxID=3032202 RepID=UPI0024A563AB|nr:MFS transporter [Actinoplanes sp. NBRC 103695]GLY97281.1 MFS transporter [Actinoplanes sp. NBRC 103695]